VFKYNGRNNPGRTAIIQLRNVTSFINGNGGQPIGQILIPGESIVVFRQTAASESEFAGTFVLEPY
jgi:hypothetical protein